MSYAREQALEPDLVAMRERFEHAAHVAWVFPTYWAAPPAIVKALVDRIFLPGWAFRFAGKALPDGLLAGRSTRVITTMDSPSIWYTLAHYRAIHGSFGRGTLSFVGFAPVKITTLYNVRNMPAAKRTGWEARISRIGRKDFGNARSTDV